MPTELKNVEITHVSLVDKGANGRKFAIIKSEEEPSLQKEVPIVKTDEEKRLVTGLVYEPGVEDSHGDFMTAEEIEKAAHLFMEEYQEVDKQHNWEGGYGKVVESWVAKADTHMGDQVVTKGSWCMTVKVEDEETWQEIKKGEVTGFSMGGVGERIEKEEDKGVMKKMLDWFKKEKLEKGELKDDFNAVSFYQSIHTLKDQFDWLFYEYIFYNEEPDLEKISQLGNDLVDIIRQLSQNKGMVIKAMNEEEIQKAEELFLSSIEKAGRKVSGKNIDLINSAIDALSKIKDEAEGNDVTKEEMQEVLKQALAPINEKVEALEKSHGIEKQEEPKEPSENEVLKSVLSEVISEQIAPIEKRLEKIEKQDLGRVSELHQDTIQKSEETDNVWSGLNL